MFARKCKENGIICSIAHSAATSEEAQKGIDNGFSHVTHFYNAVTTYHKVDQKVLAGVVEAAYLNDSVTVELICDGKHIPRDILRLALMIKGADKVSAITDGMRISGTDSTSGKLGSLNNGTDVIVDDGVAKLPDMSSYAGSIATMDRCLRVLCLDYGIDLVTASKMLSSTPARLISLESTGEIKLGYKADFVICNNDLTVNRVIKNGIVY
jgi:N-acetylglucosamine-6-phosphate deacetylase